MSQVLSIRHLSFLFLVSVLKIHAKSLSDDTYPSRTLTNFTLNDTNAAIIPDSSRNDVVNELSVERGDQDPAESSETIVYNKFKNPPEGHEESSASDEEPEGPPDHAIPYSDHEHPRNVPTRPKQRVSGEYRRLAKSRDVPLEDVPTRLYAQVRKTHTVRRLPRRKALENAESEEERENAARLREVVKNSKVNTVYTEEGYEDSAYDHAGHVRDADFHEGYARKLHEQLDARKKTGNDEDPNKEGTAASRRRYKPIDPKEFKDFDEDYSDHLEVTTDYKRLIDDSENKWESPQVVAESGIQKLQEDLEKEAEQMETGLEISKLEKDGNQNRRHEKRRRGNKRKRTRKLTDGENGDVSGEKSEEAYAENYSTTASPGDATTVAQRFENVQGHPSDAYRYEVEGHNSPYAEEIEFHGAEESPTTINYSQLFWEYFKAKQNQLTTTQAPSFVETTTLSPNLLQASSINGFVPYAIYTGENTTPFPIVDPLVLSPQKLVVAQALINPEYSVDNTQTSQLQPLEGLNVHELWQHVNTNEAPVIQPVQVSGVFDIKVPNNDQEIPLLNPERNLDSEEVPDKSLDNSFFNPTLNSVTNRKPRYKIVLRNKPKTPGESPVSSDQESQTSIPILNAPVYENTQPVLNDNYMKVLMHLKNEENAKKFYPNVLKSNSFSSSNSGDRPVDPTKLHPLRQKASQVPYQNSVPRRMINQPTRIEDGAPQKNWNEFPGPRGQRYRTNSRSTRPVPSSILQQSLKKPRNLVPAFDLLPPAPQLNSEYVRYKETRDYPTHSGSKSKPSRNVPRAYQQGSIGFDAARRIRGKRRERRSVKRREDGDETSGVVKGVVSRANNAASNRGEIERAAKNPTFERNSRRKVTRGAAVGPVPDARPAKQHVEKKSRSSDRGEGSRRSFNGGSELDVERESDVAFEAIGDEGRNGRTPANLESPGCNDTKGTEESSGGTAKAKGRKLEEKFRVANESSSAINDVVEERNKLTKEINEMSTKLQNSIHEENSGINSNSTRNQNLLNDSTTLIVDFISQETKDHSISKESAKMKRSVPNENSTVKPESNLDKAEGGKSHEELLNESPKVTDDVIEKEIKARFNEEEEKQEDQEDRAKNVEVEVPEFDYVEELAEEDRSDNASTTEATLDLEKYPFYKNEKMPTPSALKYAMDPQRIPKKTYGGMEFYSSRDAYKHCDEVEPNLDATPEKEEPDPKRGAKENSPRLRGLGDKLDCFKAKYFDDNPFDNPLFMEKEVEDPTPPREIDAKQFASRIMMFPKEDDDQVAQKSSRRPENYRRSRKPYSSAVRVPKAGRIRYATYPRTIRGQRPRVYRINGSKVRYVTTRRPQKHNRRPVSSASEMSSMYTPYQSQVYEDVMGTIKNMASSYQVNEVTTVPSSDEVTVAESNDTKTNASEKSTSTVKTEKEGVSISIVEKPSNVNINIEGLIPPKYPSRHRMAQTRDRAPQTNRMRAQKPLTGLRPVNRRRRIRIYKRSLRDDGSFEKSSERFSDFRSLDRNFDKREDVKNGNGDDKRKATSEDKAESVLVRDDTPVQKNSTASGASFKSKLPKSVPTGTSSKIDRGWKKDKPEKVVYTIKDRIRHSKPKGELKRVGKFVNGTKAEEDHRRKEPKYNYIKRRKSPNSSTTETPAPNLADKINWTHHGLRDSDVELTKENREVQYIANKTDTEILDSSQKLDDQTKKEASERSDDQASNKTGSGYAVHENINESESTTTQKPEATTLSEFSNLMAFLESDSPGYTQPTSEEFKKALFSRDNSTGFNVSFDSMNSNQDEGNATKGYQGSSFSDEESSEKAETKARVHPSTESSEESNVSSTESDSVEDRTFFAYATRPTSPAENFEDEKYSDLGERVNKPAFYHPPFSLSSDKKSESFEETSKETDESIEAKEDYVFPWHVDKEAEKKTRGRYAGKSTGEYEFPWEKRERLAREERMKGLRKGRMFDDEEAEGTYATKYRRNLYPRGRYRYWSRDNLGESTPDNLESSSEYRPVMKYSSRYNSRNSKLPLEEKSTSVRSTNLEEISRSIKKALDDNSEEKSSSKETSDSSLEKKSDTSFKARGISRGMIVPEDVTLAPRKRNGRKEIWNDRGNEGRRSKAATKNTLENSESQITVSKVLSDEIANSTKQANKRRRRPVNSITGVETSTKSSSEPNRSRRRQKMAATTPTVASTSTSTTVKPRVVRRKVLKRVMDSKKSDSKIPNKLNDDEQSEADTSRSRNGTQTGKSSRRTSRTKEQSTESPKNGTDVQVGGKSSTDDEFLKNDRQNVKGSVEETSGESIGKFDRGGARKDGKIDVSKRIFPFLRGEDESSASKDDLSDFDRSDSAPDDSNDYSKEFGSTLKTGVSYTPENGAVQLTEQGSREIISSVSWISENYDF